MEASPEGVRFLAESWVQMLKGLRAGDEGGKARSWLGVDESSEMPALLGRAEAELARLRRLAVDLDETATPAIKAARHQAGVLASFDATIEGERARRHEAAAERSFHKALRAIADHRAARAEMPTPTSVLAPPPPAYRPAPAPPRPGPAAPLGSFPPADAANAGSFRLDGLNSDLDDLFGLPGRPAPAPGSPEARRSRPDLTRFAAGRR